MGGVEYSGFAANAGTFLTVQTGGKLSITGFICSENLADTNPCIDVQAGGELTINTFEFKNNLKPGIKIAGSVTLKTG
jgi:hypothetical protein